MSDITKDITKTYCLDINCIIKIESYDMPSEAIEMDIRKKIRTKVFYGREDLELIEIGSKIYKVEEHIDEEKD